MSPYQKAELKENITHCTAFLLLLIVVFGIFICGTNWLMKNECEAQTISFDHVQYGFFGGCMVKHDDIWLPLDNVRL